MTWQDLYAGRDTNSPVSFQAELFGNGDFIYRYAFTNALSLTNFVVGAQHNGGGETYAFNDTNRLVNGLELHWRAFGLLDPNVADHDGDGLSTYDEVMIYGTDPSMPDTDLDGLGDAAEVAVGLNPLVRYSNGCDMPDGSNPQSNAWSNADGNTNGLPDAWETYWFGTNGTSGASADDNGDGFNNLANLLTGIDPAKAPPPGFAVTNGIPVTGIDAWEIAPAFALEMQSGLTNILTRTFQATRTSPWQQFFISSKPRAAGAWSLDGLALSWEGGTNVSGAATASASGDSLRLALSSNLFESLSFRLAPARTNGLVRSPAPLYLVRWTPQPAFTPGGTVMAATSSNGIPCVAAVLDCNDAPALPFTLDTASRPHMAAPTQDELAERSLQPDPGSEVRPVFTTGQTAGYLTAPYPSEAALPATSGKASTRVLLYTPTIISGGGITIDRPLGQLSPPFPLDSAGLRSQWRNNAIATDSAGSPGFTVSTGLNSEFLIVKINGIAGNSFTWDGGIVSASRMSLAAAPQASACDNGCNGAGVEYSLCNSNGVNQCVERDPDEYTHDDNTTHDDDKVKDDPACECGDPEGSDFGSLKFRIPLGNPGRDRISGFLWFAMENPQAVTPALFNILGDPSVSAATNGNVITVTSSAENGRTLVLEGIDLGVRISVYETGNVYAHKWEIANLPDDATSVRLVKSDQADNPVSDETYTRNTYVPWTRSDNLDGSRETLEISGILGPGVRSCETRTLYDARNSILSKTMAYRDVVGAGDAAAARVTEKYTLSGDGATWLSSFSFYWEDNINPYRNGRLRFRYGSAAPWEYHAYDSRGREVLKATQLDGSASPGEVALRGDIQTAAGLLAAVPGIVCAVQTFSYTPDAASGDSGEYNDSRKPRETVSYVIRSGTATVSAREWHVYTRTHGENGSVAVRTVRAASAASALADPANAVSVSAAYAGSEEPSVPVALWGLPLSEESEDGTLLTWEYALVEDTLTVTARRGTAANTNGIANVSTYDVETRNASDGLTLRRETRRYAGGGDGPLLSWEENAYDTKGHLLSTSYPDLATRTEYPNGSSDYRVTTDPLDVATISRKYYGSNCEIDESASAGVTNRTTQYWGGAAVEEKYWDGKWTSETRSTSYNANGCRVETVTIEASDLSAAVTTSQTVYDFLGREVSVTMPLGVTSNVYANGRLVRVTRTGSPDTLYVYDELGNVTATALDVDADAQVSYAGSDRISATETRYEEDASNVWWRVTSSAESVGGVTNSASEVREQLTGLSPALLSRTVTVDAHNVTTTVTAAMDPATHVVTETSWTDSGAPATRRTRYGQPVETSGAESAALFAYDGFARTVSQTVTNGTGTLSITAVAYDILGNAVTNQTTYGSLTAVTATGFDEQGRAVSRTDALGNAVFTQYGSLGQVLSLSGATYPVAYAYDTAGRMTALSTTRDGVVWDTTGWLYDGVTGLLTNKVYADGSRIAFAYTPEGRLSQKTWARGEWVRYEYDSQGRVLTNSYPSEETPGVLFGYDAAGRLSDASAFSSVGALAHYTYAHGAFSALTNETAEIFGQPFAFDFENDNRLRVSAARLAADGAALGGSYYGYDAEGRVAHAANTNSAGQGALTLYGYGGGYSTGQETTLGNGGVFMRVAVRDPHRPRLVTAVSNMVNGVAVSVFDYAHDVMGQRSVMLDREGTGCVTNAFGYNQRTEVTNAVIGTNLFVCAYDGIGNRQESARNNSTNNYTANALNQYAEIQSVSLSHDSDGNLVSDGGQDYAWDAENRMISATPSFYSNGSARVVNGYDHLHRRVVKRVDVLTGYEYAPPPSPPGDTGEWVTFSTTWFVWDNYRIAAEITVSSDGIASTNRYFWGADVSGTLDGAAGVGGLLAACFNGTNVLYCYDANGNITELLDMNNGGVMARYRYDVFGETVFSEGPVATVNPWRFATRYHDRETGLVMFPRRPYSPELGRFLSRDPIEENGGLNLYAITKNNPVNSIDPLGLCPDGYYWSPTANMCMPIPSQTPRIVPENGFSVIANIVEIDSIMGTVLQSLGMDHVDITYNAKVVYVGARGGPDRINSGKLVNNVYLLRKRKSGSIKHGSSFGLSCKCASDSDILKCLNGRKPNMTKNCQGDVQEAVSDCCLTGFRTVASTFFGWWTPDTSN